MACLVVFIALAGRRYWQFGEYVSGLDAGSWLAHGRQIFGQEGGKAHPGTYPPLIPAMLHLASQIAGPMIASKLLGCASLISVMGATAYLTLKSGCRWWLALMVGVGIGLSDPITEALAFGGYPQIVASALLALVAFSIANYLSIGSPRAAIGGLLAWIVLALTHHATFFLSYLVVSLVWMIWLTTRPPIGVITVRTVGLVLGGALPTIAFAPVLLALKRAGYQPPLAHRGSGFVSIVEAVGANISPVWLPILLAGCCYLAFTWQRRREALWQVAAAFLVSWLVLMPLTQEPRLASMLIIGACLGVGSAVEWELLRAKSPPERSFGISMIGLVCVLLAVSSDSTAANWFRYYQVVDRSLLQAAAFVDAHDDGVVAVAGDPRRWAVGWWFEGLTRARIATGSDERWLAFPVEREKARLVDRLFGPELGASQVSEIAKASNVSLLVFRKWEWLGWTKWFGASQTELAVVYDDGETMIVKVSGRTSSTGISSRNP